ncbi:hypothetical protein NQ314_015101 [Rhamnusium bicolor]|uniref:DDE-1 domain-containing protein n=1 Tax=Rhamnusium bicolor TaxID=1586634 RepID=A0AAV8WZH9_9CUCU|nr:hypothetical protein NQ314_015101 [Rhamnusium bicolor]
MPKVTVESIPENWGLGRSDSGWMNSEVFFEYVSNHFIHFLKSENITRPVILFVDGHRSHLTQEVSKLCDENGVILISLFPNTTHIMQPADVSVFKPLKAGWKSSVRNWKFENFAKEVTRFTFGSILKAVFDEYATVKTIQNGFRKCGLYPFDKNNVDYSKCIPNRKTEIPNGTDQTSGFPEKVLAIIESKIGMELGEFKNTYTRKENWSGKVESTNLYKVWLSIKNDCTITPQQQSQIETVHVTAEVSDNISNNLVGEGDLAETGGNQRENGNLEGSPKRQVEKDEDRENSLTSTERIVHVSPVPRVRPSTSWATPENASITFYDKRESEGFKVPTPFKKYFRKLPKQKHQHENEPSSQLWYQVVYTENIIMTKCKRRLHQKQRRRKKIGKNVG